MEIIVQHKQKGSVGLLVSGGFGLTVTKTGVMSWDQNPGYEEKAGMILVTNDKGDLLWVESKNYKVVGINGMSPTQYFGDIASRIPKSSAGPKKLNV